MSLYSKNYFAFLIINYKFRQNFYSKYDIYMERGIKYGN